MFENLVVSQCAPTMAGLKTGNLFTCPFAGKDILHKNLRRMNEALVPRGARILPLRYGESRVLLYMYRPDQLKKDLADAAALDLLRQREYPCENSEKCLLELIRRLRAQEDFPHEIGLFLGYPPEDVLGFIENKAEKAKTVGTWKVYGDEKEAQRKFDLYRKCTRIYCDIFRKNHSFDRLIVAVS